MAPHQRLPLLVLTALLAGTLASCGEGDRHAVDDATTPAAVQGHATVPITPPGLAAAVIAHLGETQVSASAGGVTDMEDQRYVGVDLALGGRRDRLHVEVHDPTYLPDDAGREECEVSGEVVEENGMTSSCEVLPDGTVVEVYYLPMGMTDGNDHGAFAMADVSGPERRLQVSYESWDRATALDSAAIAAIATDPAIAWLSTEDVNAAGAELTGFTRRDRVDRDGEGGYDESVPDVRPASPAAG
jgi:hypothetical protein